MAATIRLKRSTGTGAPASLKTGEIAYSYGGGTSANLGDRLFFGKGDDGAGNATSVVVVGGEYLGNMLDHTPGTLTASSALITDASSKLDNIKIDNIDINGNTISSTDTNGNVILDPNGLGVVDVSVSRVTNVVNPVGNQDAATKLYVDTVAGAKFITFTGDAGSDTVNLSDSSVAISGGTGLSTAVTNNLVTVNLDNTGVSANTYGSSTAIPILAINAQGQVTSASTASIASTLNLAGDAGTGDVSLLDSSFSIAGGTGISTSAANNVITITGDDATTSTKGIASFSSDNFAVTAGAVTIKTGGVANAELVNSSLTIGTTAIALGASSTVLAGLTQIDVDNIRILDNTIASSTGVLYIDPNPIDSDGGEVIIRGNLTVNGVTTTVNSTTVSINDKNLVLADSAISAGEADGAGLTVNGPTVPATITYNGSTDAWNLNKALDLSALSALKIGGEAITEALEDHLVTNFLLAGEGIDLTYVDGSNTLTIAAELATVLNPGVANFDSDQMTVVAGLVSVYQLDGGVY